MKALYILPLLLISQIFNALTPLYYELPGLFRNACGFHYTFSSICCISLSLSVLIIPRWGVYGAGVVSIASNACYFAFPFIIKVYIQKE